MLTIKFNGQVIEVAAKISHARGNWARGLDGTIYVASQHGPYRLAPAGMTPPAALAVDGHKNVAEGQRKAEARSFQAQMDKRERQAAAAIAETPSPAQVAAACAGSRWHLATAVSILTDYGFSRRAAEEAVGDEFEKRARITDGRRVTER